MKLNPLVRFTALVVAGMLIASTSAIRLICPSVCAADQNVEILNNASIIKLQSLNLGDEVIVDKIKTSKTDFDVTVDGIIRLKEAKVSGSVISAMINAKSQKPATHPVTTVTDNENKQPPVGDINDPNTYHDSGVWFYEEVGGVKKMTQLSTETYDVSQFYGPFGIHNRAIVISEVSAKTQITSSKPVFYMYFGEGRKDNGDMFGTLTPDQVPLAHLKVINTSKKQERTISIGSGGAYGGTMGVPSKEKRAIEWSKVGLGIYRVTPRDSLASGEYAFIFSHSQMQGGVGGKLFCFGVH